MSTEQPSAVRKLMADYKIGFLVENRNIEMHFNDFEQAIEALIAERIIDELKTVSFRTKDALRAKYGPRVIVRTHLTDEYIDKRLAELKRGLDTNHEQAK